MSYAKKTDRNQSDIIKALRQVGASVESLHRVGRGVPDLLVGRVMPCPCCGAQYPRNMLIETKVENRTLNARQVAFHATWRGPICVVHTIEEAIKIIGVEA
jgi:hypothetical protein